MEVAGLVFGVIPLAITALDKYGQVAERLGHFYRIRVEHKKWKKALSYSQILLRDHLAELLVPVLDLEHNQVLNHLDDEYGQLRQRQPWADPQGEVAQLLAERLPDPKVYKTYMGYLSEIGEIATEITRLLALDSPEVQAKLASPQLPGAKRFWTRVKDFCSSENRAFQWYRLKFSVKGSESRRNLFRDLQDCIDKLEKLLKVSDRNRQRSQLSSQRSDSSLGAATQQAFSNFWRHADRFFHALAASWNCECKAHVAHLLLRHRTHATPEFEVLLSRQLKVHPSTSWKIRNTKFVFVGNQERAKWNLDMTRGTAPIHAPAHRDSQPVKSAMGKAGGSKGKSAMFREVESTQTVTITQVPQEDNWKFIANKIRAHHSLITSLCEVLQTPASSSVRIQGESCYGYFLDGPDKDSYQVYDIITPDLPNPAGGDLPATMTLERIMESGLFQTFKRLSRYELALALASSFVQLLETPWMLSTLTKSDIHFMDENPNSEHKKLPKNQVKPYLQLPSKVSIDESTPPSDDMDDNNTTTTTTKENAAADNNPDPVQGHAVPYLQNDDINTLAKLGLILFELCFNQPIRSHPLRKEWDTKYQPGNEFTRSIFDIQVAQHLLEDLQAEAGVQAREAISWCFTTAQQMGGVQQEQWKTSAGGLDRNRWRMEMWVNVVERLKRSCHFMVFGDVTPTGPTAGSMSSLSSASAWSAMNTGLPIRC